MARIALWLVVCGLLAGASRCGKDDETDEGGGSQEGGGSAGTGDTGGDSGGEGERDGAGVRCGPKVCDEGQVCCNESCGICTEPGGFCTEQFCGDPEDPTDPGDRPQDPPTNPDGPRCGGITGESCPGSGTCVDDPSDDCDPENGGADCGGMCACLALGICVDGFVWNESPEVCDCEPIKGGGDPGDPGEGEACGNVTCGAGQVCCNESCGICTEPGGFCTQQVCDDPGPPPFCGGIAGFPCPGQGECVDDPSDDCDPENGGADCGGICKCPPQLGPVVLCPQGAPWNPSPEVCACQAKGGSDPAGETCGKNVCPRGQVCCNASCGICAPPDGACIQIACL